MKSVWAEKYRPKSIRDILVPPFVREKLDCILENRNIPHMIITGEPGIGKTTTSLCLARDLLGENYSQFVLELNASNDRGIKSVQRIIVPFCQLSTGNVLKTKIILLDEADSMTDKEQQIISKLMDKYEKNTRFIFTCNSSISIIESIQSRCNILRFKPIANDLIKERLLYICGKEKIKHTDAGINLLIRIINGDMRNAINILQSVYMGLGEITVETIKIICNIPPQEPIEKAIVRCLKKGKIDLAIEEINNLKDLGYSCIDIINTIFNVARDSKKIDNSVRINVLKEIANTYTIIKKGVQSQLQLYACMSRIARQRESKLNLH